MPLHLSPGPSAWATIGAQLCHGALRLAGRRRRALFPALCLFSLGTDDAVSAGCHTSQHSPLTSPTALQRLRLALPCILASLCSRPARPEFHFTHVPAPHYENTE